MPLRVVTLVSFQGDVFSNQLEFPPNAFLIVQDEALLNHNKTGWGFGTVEGTNRSGWFPATYVRVVSEPKGCPTESNATQGGLPPIVQATAVGVRHDNDHGGGFAGPIMGEPVVPTWAQQESTRPSNDDAGTNFRSSISSAATTASTAFSQGAQKTGAAVSSGARKTGEAVSYGAQKTGAALSRGAQKSGEAMSKGASKVAGFLSKTPNSTRTAAPTPTTTTTTTTERSGLFNRTKTVTITHHHHCNRPNNTERITKSIGNMSMYNSAFRLMSGDTRGAARAAVVGGGFYAAGEQAKANRQQG